MLEQPLIDAKENLTKTFLRSCKNGFFPEEADNYVNDASRRVIREMHELYGRCWLGNVNLYKGEEERPATEFYEAYRPQTAIWEYTGKTVYNFGCSFVTPQFDRLLEKLIQDRMAAPYTGTEDDRVRVEAIHERLEEINGVHLHWA